MIFIEAQDQTVRAFLFDVLIKQRLLKCAFNVLAQKCIKQNIAQNILTLKTKMIQKTYQRNVNDYKHNNITFEKKDSLSIHHMKKKKRRHQCKLLYQTKSLWA